MKSIDKINMFLAQKGMSGAEMSVKAGLSNSAYSQWNTGKTKPGKKTLSKVASVLDVEVVDIMDDDDIGLPNGYQAYLKSRHELAKLKNELTTDEKKPVPTDGNGLSPARAALLAAVDGMSEDEIYHLLNVIEAVKGK